MTRVVVAGYGNPLRSDDGAGWHVAQAVALRWGNQVRVLMGHQPTPEWAPELAAADVAFLVDASIEASRGLRVRRLEPADAGRLVDGHTLGPEQLLGLAGALYGSIPETYLLLLPTEHLDFGEELSPTTARASEQALCFLGRRLNTLDLRDWGLKAPGAPVHLGGLEGAGVTGP